MNPKVEDPGRRLRQANTEARSLLAGAVKRMQASLQDEFMRVDIPMEVLADLELALDDLHKALHWLESAAPAQPPVAPPAAGRPTRQQGQFLAFIREYMLRNEAGVAPSHADLQRFFNLTPPSVNSMLIRLEQRGFIRRVPHSARAIELILDPEWIPPLDRPFKF
jgi:repressor LexA